MNKSYKNTIPYYYLLALVYFIVFLFFNSTSILIYQNLTLRTTPNFITPFFSYAGGISELLGILLSNLYKNPISGALLISSIYILSAYLTKNILYPSKHSITNKYVFILPAIVLVSMHFSPKHSLSFDIGILITLLLLYLSHKIKTTYYTKAFFQTLILISIWYTSGFALYATSLLIITIHYAFSKHFKSLIIIWLLSILTIVFLSQIVFFSPLKNELNLLLTHDYNIPYLKPIVLILLVIVYALSKYNIPKTKPKYLKLALTTGFAIGISILSFNKTQYTISKILSYGYQNKHQKLIDFVSNTDINSQLTTANTNYALFSKGELLDKMFFYPQNYGNQGMSPNTNPNGFDAFLNMKLSYKTGFINETIRWAMEAASIMGFNAEILSHLTLAHYINANNKASNKYKALLNKTAFATKEIKKVNKLIREYRENTISSELAKKITQKPFNDFITLKGNHILNYEWVITNDMLNKEACEAFAAICLLDKQLKYLPYVVRKMKQLNYKSLPIHIQEAACYLYHKNNTLPNLYGFKLDDKIMRKSGEYLTMKQSLPKTEEDFNRLLEDYSGTYWIYFDFVE